MWKNNTKQRPNTIRRRITFPKCRCKRLFLFLRKTKGVGKQKRKDRHYVLIFCVTMDVMRSFLNQMFILQKIIYVNILSVKEIITNLSLPLSKSWIFSYIFYLNRDRNVAQHIMARFKVTIYTAMSLVL